MCSEFLEHLLQRSQFKMNISSFLQQNEADRTGSGKSLKLIKAHIN